MTNLLFLHDKLLRPQFLRTFKMPIHFISFAYVDGFMYTHERKRDTFIVKEISKLWGNRIVYGAMFILHDFDFYIRQLDGYYSCSLSALRRNHARDLHHRLIVPATPITFSSLSDMGRLLYDEKESTKVYCYFGNPSHPKIRPRFKYQHTSRRVIEGIRKPEFKRLYEEVEDEGIHRV